MAAHLSSAPHHQFTTISKPRGWYTTVLPVVNLTGHPPAITHLSQPTLNRNTTSGRACWNRNTCLPIRCAMRLHSPTVRLHSPRRCPAAVGCLVELQWAFFLWGQVTVTCTILWRYRTPPATQEACQGSIAAERLYSNDFKVSGTIHYKQEAGQRISLASTAAHSSWGRCNFLQAEAGQRTPLRWTDSREAREGEKKQTLVKQTSIREAEASKFREGTEQWNK